MSENGSGTAVAKKKADAVALVDQVDLKMIEFFEKAVDQAAIAGGLERERVVKSALLSVQRDSKLTAGWADKPQLRSSMALALIDSAQTGLECDGRRAALVRYKDTITYQRMVWGILELVYRSGGVKVADARIVYENDRWSHYYDPDPVVRHEPAKGDRGQAVLVYAYARLENDALLVEPMDRDQVYAIRERSKAWKNNGGPWVTDELEMWRKTALLRLMKRLPQSEKLHDAIDREMEIEYGEAIVEPDPDFTPPPARSKTDDLAARAGVAPAAGPANGGPARGTETPNGGAPPDAAPPAEPPEEIEAEVVEDTPNPPAADEPQLSPEEEAAALAHEIEKERKKFFATCKEKRPEWATDEGEPRRRAFQVAVVGKDSTTDMTLEELRVLNRELGKLTPSK